MAFIKSLVISFFDIIKQSFCYHRWRFVSSTSDRWTESGLLFTCTRCGKEIFLNCDIPYSGTKHIWHFDGHKSMIKPLQDIDTYLSNMDILMFHCKHCGKKMEIEVKEEKEV